MTMVADAVLASTAANAKWPSSLYSGSSTTPSGRSSDARNRRNGTTARVSPSARRHQQRTVRDRCSTLVMSARLRHHALERGQEALGRGIAKQTGPTAVRCHRKHSERRILAEQPVPSRLHVVVLQPHDK